MVTKTSTKRKGKRTVDDFVSRVKERLESTGMSISELAVASKISRPYVSRVLSRHQTPSLDIADRIAACVGLKISITDK